MRKVLLFLMVCATMSLSAQSVQLREMMSTLQPREVSDVDEDQIQFWVGTGENEAVAALYFCATPPVGIVYGYRFDGTSTIGDMLNAIAAADPNFLYEASSFITSLGYDDGTIVCPNVGYNVMYTVNGAYAMGLSDPIADGDYFEATEYGDCELPVDNLYYPVDPNATTTPEDAIINADQIQYWIGTGDNKAILIVNWCNPDTALAWGYRFSADSVLVATMINDIAAADPRLSFEGESYLTDILFVSGDGTFAIAPDWIMYNISGGYANAVDIQKFADGDYVKFGGYSCADFDENYNATWDTPVAPVDAPNAVTDHSLTALSIAPNPCTNHVGVRTSANEVVSIYNLQGALMMRTIATDEVTNLDVRELPAGIYFVQSGNRTAKMVKK